MAGLRTLAAAVTLALCLPVGSLSAGAVLPDRHLEVTPHDDGLAFWFEVEGIPGRNPDIHIAPGATVSIHLRNNGTVPHDFWVNPLGGVLCCVAPGGEGNGSFIAPMADTALSYACTLHKTSGMSGSFVVGEGVDQSTPGPAWVPVLGVLAVAATLQFRKRFA